jgi:hypothetical protein
VADLAPRSEGFCAETFLIQPRFEGRGSLSRDLYLLPPSITEGFLRRRLGEHRLSVSGSQQWPLRRVELVNSGDVKGTITNALRYHFVPNDVRRHRLISISYIIVALSRQGQKVRQGTRGCRREPEGISQSLICGGVVQRVRTPVTQEAAGSSPVAPAIQPRMD